MKATIDMRILQALFATLICITAAQFVIGGVDNMARSTTSPDRFSNVEHHRQGKCHGHS